MGRAPRTTLPSPLLAWPGFFGAEGPQTAWELMRRMSEQVDQLFESLGGARGALASGTRPNLPAAGGRRAEGSVVGAASRIFWAPPIEVLQQPNEIVVRADLPGLKPDDVNVSVEDGVLTIRGERRQGNREERDGFVHTERSYGAFHRTLPLPEGADENRIAASFRDGVLEVKVPVSPRERGRRIAVQS